MRARLAEALNLNCYSFLDLRVIYHIIELVCHLSHYFNHIKRVLWLKWQNKVTVTKQQTNTQFSCKFSRNQFSEHRRTVCCL